MNSTQILQLENNSITFVFFPFLRAKKLVGQKSLIQINTLKQFWSQEDIFGFLSLGASVQKAAERIYTFKLLLCTKVKGEKVQAQNGGFNIKHPV